MADSQVRFALCVVHLWTLISACKALQISINTANPVESETVTLVCHANPNLKEVFFIHAWEGDEIRKIQRNVTGQNATFSMKSTLENIGDYVCQGISTSNNVSLYPLAAPRLVSSWLTVIHAEPKDEVILTGTFLNVSELHNVTWSFEGEQIAEERFERAITTVPIDFRMYDKDVIISGSNVTLEFTMTSFDFGHYDVTVCNNSRCSSAKFTLELLVPPKPPTGLRVVENLTDGFWFTWRSEVNKGGDQVFQLAYRRTGRADDWSIKNVPDPTGPGLPVFAKISGLLSNTGYDVKVNAIYVRNKNKFSNYTAILKVFVQEPFWDNFDFGAGIGLGAGSVVFFGVGVCFFLYACRRNKGRASDPLIRQANHSSSMKNGSSSRHDPPFSSSGGSNTYLNTSDLVDPKPDLPRVPDPPRRTIIRPPVPGGRENCPPLPGEEDLSRDQTSKNRLKIAAAQSVRPPLPLPLKIDEMYEPVEGAEEEEEDDGARQEYVDPMMAYENMK